MGKIRGMKNRGKLNRPVAGRILERGLRAESRKRRRMEPAGKLVLLNPWKVENRMN
jgi:hypothetical protein